MERVLNESHPHQPFDHQTFDHLDRSEQDSLLATVGTMTSIKLSDQAEVRPHTYKTVVDG